MNINKQYNLTSRQKDIIPYLVRGYCNKDIANALYISERTVESHLRGLYKKLKVKNRTAATDLLLSEPKIEECLEEANNYKRNTFQVILDNILCYRLKSEEDNHCSAEYHLAMSAFAARNNCKPEYIESLPPDFKRELNDMCALIKFT